LFANSTWTGDDKKLTFCGLLAKTKKTGFTTIVSGEYNISQKTISGVKETELATSSFLQNSTEKYLKGISKEGIPGEAGLVASFAEPDGSVILILEKTQMIQTRSNGFDYTDFRSGDLYVVRIKAMNELDWIKIIPKNQLEPMAYTFTGIISTADGKGGVLLIFHDNGKNENTDAGDKASQATLQTGWKNISLAVVAIHKDGTISKKFIFDNSTTDFHLAPQQPYLINRNTLVFTSYDQKTMGRSNYRIGIIQIR
jgi:hypothetical protein